MRLPLNRQTIIPALAITPVAALVALATAERARPWLRQSAGNTSHTIVLGESGFELDVLTIRRGDTVTFTTDRNVPFWPASDLHPIHDLYPEFDPQEPIPPGERWSFRFERTGEWAYHDHLAPYYRGTVTVTDDGRPSAGIECGRGGRTASEARRCWEESLRVIIAANGVDTAFEELARLYKAEPTFAQECHSYAHLIGQAAYAEFSRERAFPVTPKTTYCGYGFYHGVMEAMLAKTGNLAEARQFCLYMDTALAGAASNATLACFHGIGHGVVDGSDRSAWGNDQAIIEPGLALCDQVASTEQEYYRCYSGAFNSLAIAYWTNQYGLSLNKKDPLGICRRQRDDRRLACYTDMTTALMVITKDDLAAAVRFVDRIAEERFALPTMATLSSLAVRQRLNAANYEDVVEVCHDLTLRLRVPCVQGFGNGLMEFGRPPEEYIKAFSFCALPSLAAEEQAACFRSVIGYATMAYPREKVHAICRTVPDALQHLCPKI